MITDDVRKLLGGYATNTLTEEERKALFEAALEDQDLFNALQDEQALKDLLDDASARQALRQALEPAPAAKPARGRFWVWAGAFAAVAACVIAFVVLRPHPAQHPIELAQNMATTRSVAEEPAQPARPAAPPAAPADTAQSGTRDKVAEKKAEQPRPVQREQELSMQRFSPSAGLGIPMEAGSAGAARTEGLGGGGGGHALPPPPASTPRAIGLLGGNAVRESVVAGNQSGVLTYSFVRRDNSGVEIPVTAQQLMSGDVVRIRVSSSIAGNLSLLQQQDSDWLIKVVGFPIAAGSVVTFDPDIAVLATSQRLLIELRPDSGPPVQLQFQIVGH